MPFILCCIRFRFIPARKIIYYKNYSSSINNNLLNLLKKMPKEHKHIAEAQKNRIKMKEKLSKYVPGKVTLQVLGTGAPGAPRALYLFSDQSRYLFNCGEGTQRLAHEHKMKLAKLEQIFITHPIWKNIGGLPGITLTIQDIGVPEIVLHGPKGLEEIFVATKRFVILRDLKVRKAECNENDMFQDNVMKVQYVQLTASVLNNSIGVQFGPNDLKPQHKHHSRDKSDETFIEDDTDYYAHERKRSKKRRRSKSRSLSRDRGGRTQTEQVSLEKQKILRELKEKGVSMCYICQLHPRPGSLNLDKCVKLGVTPGPLLGKLKSGEDVVLPNGTTVSSKDVCEPDEPGPVFLVVDCPTEEYLPSLVSNLKFEEYQNISFVNNYDHDKVACLVVHFTPQRVVENQLYKEWMNKFSASTQHLIINDTNTCMGSAAVHKIQQKLNLLSDDLFPILGDKGSIIINSPIELNDQFTKKPKLESSITEEKNVKPISPPPKIYSDSCIHPNTFCNFHLRPKKGLDRSLELTVTPNEYIEETMNLETFPTILKDLKVKYESQKRKYPIQEYPKIVFTGTGSCIPNKTRNTSGILLQTNEANNILIDCGEGTYGQLVRFFGQDKIDRVLANLHGIYISHLHADHHMGLLGILQGRKTSLEKLNRTKKPLFLFAPIQIMSWLNLYDSCFEDIRELFELVPNGQIMQGKHERDYKNIFESLEMTDISTCYVKHCPNSFGVAFTYDERYKITYSGDTMPCENLIELGQNSDLLIHEATMEDELKHEAVIKMHSTTSEAIDVGRKMGAKNILLTHFSQRYAKLPRFNDNFGKNVSFAFDNMQVRLDELRLVPNLYPALKVMFAEQYEELEQKAEKRLLKIEREREHTRGVILDDHLTEFLIKK